MTSSSRSEAIDAFIHSITKKTPSQVLYKHISLLVHTSELDEYTSTDFEDS